MHEVFVPFKTLRGQFSGGRDYIRLSTPTRPPKPVAERQDVFGNRACVQRERAKEMLSPDNLNNKNTLCLSSTVPKTLLDRRDQNHLQSVCIHNILSSNV